MIQLSHNLWCERQMRVGFKLKDGFAVKAFDALDRVKSSLPTVARQGGVGFGNFDGVEFEGASANDGRGSIRE